MADRSEQQNLDLLWQELLGGEAGTDRTVTDALRHALTLYSAPTPGSARERARQRVFASTTSFSKENTMSATTLPIPFPSPDGYLPPAKSPSRPVEIGYRRSRRWVLAQLAAAALLIMAVIGGYVWFEGRNEHPAVLLQETPEATPTGAWTHFKGNAARTGFAENGPIEQPIELWRVSVGEPCYQAPIVVGPTVYAGCGDGVLYALNASDGSELWRFDAGFPIGGGLAFADGIVYFTDDFGALHAIDGSTGAELWGTESLELGQIAIDSGKVVAPSGNGMLRAFDAATGAELWTYQVAEQGGLRGPGIANGIVYVGGDGGDLTAVDLETGELRWRGESGDGGTGTAFVADGITTTTATDADGSARIVAFDAETGEELWRRDGQLQTPVTNGALAFAASQQNGTVYAFNLSDGAPAWEVVLGGVIRPMAVTSDVLYVPIDTEQAVVALDVNTGRELWRVTVDGGIGESIAVVDGRLYVTTAAGSIYAFGPADPSVIVAPFGPADASPSPVASEEATATLLWESTGSAEEPLISPVDVAIHPDGTVWVLGKGNQLLQVLDPETGEFIEAWGEPGAGDGQLDVDGGGLVFDHEGNLYVTDTAHLRVQKFDPDGNFVLSWGSQGTADGQFQFIEPITVDADGNVYVADGTRNDVQKFSSNGAYLMTIGESGADPGQLLRPGYMAVDAAGILWIGELGNNRISKFALDGTFLGSFGSSGSGEGEFRGPNSVSVDASGTVFVADIENQRIQVFDTDGNFIDMWGEYGIGAGQLNYPANVELDGQGNLYVVNVETGRVQKWDVSALLDHDPVIAAPLSPDEGSPVTVSSPSALNASPVELVWTVEGGDGGFDNPNRMAFDPDGHLWVADNGNNRFQIFDTDGNYLESWGESGSGDGQFQLRRANGDGYGDIAFAEDGSFYVLDPGNFRVQKFDADRTFVTSWGGFGSDPGQFREPVALAVDDAGSLWVVDDVRNEVQHFDQNGQLLGAFAALDDSVAGFNTINGLGIDDEGNLYVSDIPGAQVIKFSPDGTRLATYGKAGTGEGEFRDQPIAIAVDSNGNVYISEGPGGGSVQVFEPDGSYLTGWGQQGEFPWGVVIDDGGNLYVTDHLANTLSKYRLLPPLGPEATPAA